MGETLTATDGEESAQESHDLLGIEWPVELGTGIKTAQDRNTQTVILDPIFIFRDVHQLDHQTVLDQGHQFFFGKFTEMATQGAEQLTFRRHDYKSRQSRGSF